MRRTLTLSVLVAAFLVAVGGQTAEASTAHASVVGGVPAGDAYPFMAFIALEEAGDEGACSGTLVASNMVLTAAHCIVNEATDFLRAPEGVHVLIGTPNYLSGGRWYTATAVYVDPIYRVGRLWHDAGVIELPGPVPAPTIALAEREVPARTSVSVLGWGLTEATATEDSAPTTSELMVGQTVVQSGTYCARNAFPFYPASQLCSIDYPSYQSATCFGDSGGPMIVNVSGVPVEVGITSHSSLAPGEPSCSPTAPRVDTRADVEAAWVHGVAEEHEPTLPTLTDSQAIHDTFNVLQTGPFRSHFSGRYQYRVRCRRIEASKMQCEPEWGAGGNDYYGTVTIYLLWAEGEPVWSYRYRLSWVRDACYVRYRNCPTWTRTN